MHRMALTVVAQAAAAALMTAAATAAMAGGLGEAAELEHARANARAGGPIAERDKELLERYGCLSGTDNDFCRRIERRQRVDSHPRRRHRRDDD